MVRAWCRMPGWSGWRARGPPRPDRRVQPGAGVSATPPPRPRRDSRAASYRLDGDGDIQEARGSNPPMRPLRYSINVTLDGCCDHRVMIADDSRIAIGPPIWNEPMPCSWPGDLRDDGGGVAGAGEDGSAA